MTFRRQAFGGGRGFLAVFILALFVVASCKGPAGPMGPGGPKGDKGDTGLQGPQGPQGAGTRVVYQGTIPQPGGQVTISVPQLTFSNPPLIAVYVRFASGEWTQDNYYWEDVSGAVQGFEFAVLHEGLVDVISLQGVEYRIVLVI